MDQVRKVPPVRFPSLIPQFDPVAEQLWKTVAYSLIAVLALVGNSLIGIIVCKTPTLNKPINLSILNMATSDLLYPIFLFPVLLAELHFGSWLIDGALGQALCKLHVFLTDVSSLLSIQSLILIRVDQLHSVPPSSVPSIVSCPFLSRGLSQWQPYLFAFSLVENPEGMMCQRQWKEALWRFLFAGYHFSLTSYYFISHRAVSFGLAAVLFYTKLSPPLWLTQTVSSTRLSASF